MALKKTKQTSTGFNAVDAYHRVEFLTIDKNLLMTFYIRSYKNRNIDTFFEERILSCQYVLNNKNPFRQAYDFLKSDDFFSDAEDDD